MKKSWRIWLGVLITLIFLVIAFRGQDFNAIRQALRDFNYIYLIPALALLFTGIWFRAVRWRILLKPVVEISSRDVFPIVIIGFMANNILPLRAGELARTYALSSKTGAKKSATLATIAVERLFDGVTMLGFILISATVISLTSNLRHLAVIAFIIFTCGILFLVLLTLSGNWRDRILQIVLGPLPETMADRIEQMAESFLVGLGVLRHRRDLALVAAYSVIAWSFEASTYWMIAKGFGDPLAAVMSPAAALLTTGVANLATLIPSSPGYVGPFETGVKWVVEGALGMSGSLALSYAILVHATLFFPVTILGLFVLWRQHISLGQLREAEDEMKVSEVA
jgi:uncharacterized protein (TIRG00374 family)